MKSRIFSILFFFGCITMAAQSGTITGSVTDSSNNDLLPGVNVLVKNTTNGTNTDFNGNFSLNNVSNGDVLVFSYMSQKAANISGAVSTVDGEAVEKLKPVRVEDALQGQSGLNVISSGTPGAKPTVLIRGISSYSGNDPLVIVDGVNLTLDDMNTLDPSNIESNISISTTKARSEGFTIKRNDSKVAKAPKTMTNNGFLN